MLKENKDETELTREDVQKKLQDVLKLFEKQRKDDPSGEVICHV